MNKMILILGMSLLMLGCGSITKSLSRDKNICEKREYEACQADAREHDEILKRIDRGKSARL